MTKCPQCFFELPPSPQELICVGTCNAGHNDAASSLIGFSVNARPIVPINGGGSQDKPYQGTCSGCGLVTTTEACPHCKYEIPALWRQHRVTCVAMAGARSSGKSLHVATAVLQLDPFAEAQWNSPVEPLGSTAVRFQEIYLKPLMEERQLVQATPPMGDISSPSREPLIFRFSERINGEVVPRILVLKDVAGEDLERPDADRRQFSFFSRADAVFVMIDPMKVPEIRAILADVVPTPKMLGEDPRKVLGHVLAHMTDHVPGAVTRIPIAVIISKFDVIQKLRDVENPKWTPIMSRAGSPMQRDTSHSTPQWDVVQGMLLHEEVRGLLDLIGESLIESTLQDRAPHHFFFAASALGEPPDDELLHERGIAPFRVLDPFKWALSF